MRMEEPEVVAAIVAGDPAGLAEALDMYATSLFAYCRSILPQAGAADVVETTFVVARAKLDGLTDPARLGQWLQAVARNECFRRVIANGGIPPAEPITVVPDLALPEGLVGRIIKVCTDETPLGRANRTTMSHQAGPFGYDGFPKPVIVAKPRRAPRTAAAVAAVVGAVAVVAVLVVVLAGGSPSSRLAASGVSSPTGIAAGVPTLATDTSASPTTSPRRTAKPKVALADTRSPAASATTSALAVKTGTLRPSPPPGPKPSSSPHSVAPATRAPRPAPSVSASTYTPPPKPVLIVDPTSMSLVSTNGATVTGDISIIGFGSTVHWSATVATGGGHITASPAAGTLEPGAETKIRVSAHATASFVAHITLMPGDHIVTVTVTAKKVVTKKSVTYPKLSSSRRDGAVAGPSRVTARAAAALARRAADAGSSPSQSPARNTPAWASPAPVVSTTSTDGAGTVTRSSAVATTQPSAPIRTSTARVRRSS